jgi:hypothetical protein
MTVISFHAQMFGDISGFLSRKSLFVRLVTQTTTFMSPHP